MICQGDPCPRTPERKNPSQNLWERRHESPGTIWPKIPVGSWEQRQKRFGPKSLSELLLAAAVTARVRGVPCFTDNGGAAMLALPCPATATKLHATLFLRSALRTPQSQSVETRAHGVASPTTADAHNGSRVHIHFVARVACSRTATWTTKSFLELSLLLTILTDIPTIPLLCCIQAGMAFGET